MVHVATCRDRGCQRLLKDQGRPTKESYFCRFLCEFGQLIQALQVRLSDIFEICIDCHKKAHEMRIIHKAGHMPLSRTLSRLITVEKIG